MDASSPGFGYPPLSWALEPECEILMFMWSFGALRMAAFAGYSLGSTSSQD